MVRAETPAAKAGLIVSDTIAAVDGTTLLDKKAAYNYLLETVQWGKPLQLTVRRGLPQPFASHPRLDLFVGSLSPHTMADVGCTICHEGQGSATTFKWASHTPSDPLQAEQVEARIWLVQQPSLDLSDVSQAVRGKQLLEVPSRSGRIGAERAVPRSAGSEAGGGLRT